MSIIGILAWKSVLNNNASYPVPDFGNETARAAVADDDWSLLQLRRARLPAVCVAGLADHRPGEPWRARRRYGQRVVITESRGLY